MLASHVAGTAQVVTSVLLASTLSTKNIPKRGQSCCKCLVAENGVAHARAMPWVVVPSVRHWICQRELAIRALSGSDLQRGPKRRMVRIRAMQHMLSMQVVMDNRPEPGCKTMRPATLFMRSTRKNTYIRRTTHYR